MRDEEYRQRALKMYPWLCARCGREFGGKGLRELTVHHKDHDHDNNPLDGSNWELLCLYCHDEEHAKYVSQPGSTRDRQVQPLTHKPFAALAGLLKDESS